MIDIPQDLMLSLHKHSSHPTPFFILFFYLKSTLSLIVTALIEPMDIYSEWIDECKRVNNLEDDGA